MADKDSDLPDIKGDEAGPEGEADDNVENGGEDGGESDDKQDDDAADVADNVNADEESEKQDRNPQDKDGDGKPDDQQQSPGEETTAEDDGQTGNVENEAEGPHDGNERDIHEADDANDQDGKTSPTQDGDALEEEGGDAAEEGIDNQGAGDDGVEDEGVVDEGVVDDGVTDDKEEEEEGQINGAPALSDEQRARCRQLFDRQAVNGRLDLKGFKTVFRLMGEVLSSSDAEQMFDEGDKDDNGTIEFDEFARLYALYSQEEETRKQAMMESIEKLFPSNGDQQLELKKVEQVLLKLQHPGLDLRLSKEKSDLCPEDIKSLVRAMDADGSGRISKQEFVDTLCQRIEG